LARETSTDLTRDRGPGLLNRLDNKGKTRDLRKGEIRRTGSEERVKVNPRNQSTGNRLARCAGTSSTLGRTRKTSMQRRTGKERTMHNKKKMKKPAGYILLLETQFILFGRGRLWGDEEPEKRERSGRFIPPTSEKGEKKNRIERRVREAAKMASFSLHLKREKSNYQRREGAIHSSRRKGEEGSRLSRRVKPEKSERGRPDLRIPQRRAWS